MEYDFEHIKENLIPKYVTHVTETLKKAGFEVFLVGGCVRDLVRQKTPKDWDITTNARPDDIMPLFQKTVYENNFGTVGVCIPKKPIGEVTHETKEVENEEVSPETIQSYTGYLTNRNYKMGGMIEKYDIVEVTPYRVEAKYSDFRHPDDVQFSDKIEDDLKRRDFTINAMAYNPHNGQVIDLFKGQEDIKDKVIRAVGNAADRFQEDALRMLRAIRLATQLGFALSYDTMKGIEDNADLLSNISAERIRDEFIKIIMSDDPMIGIALLSKLGLLKHIVPELEDGIGCEQRGEHIYDVWEHLLHALEHAGKKGWPLEVRLAALLHDVGKPKTRRWDPQKNKYTFYGHEVVGARLTKKIMERLKFPKKTAELVLKLVRGHMFFSDTETITLSAVRRVIQSVGREHIWDLMNIRECDRVGMKKKETPYRLRKYHAMIEEVLRDPISVSQLAIDGKDLMEDLKMKPSPRMGWILSSLLEEVLDDPSKNTKEHLLEISRSLDMLGDEELKVLGERGKVKKEQLEEEEIDRLYKKHGV